MHRHLTTLRATLLLGALILLTTAAFATWDHIDLGIYPDLRAVDVTTPALATMVGDGIIFNTTDGGWSWQPVTPPIVADYRGVAFFNPDTGVACGDMGTIIRTTNGGGAWDSIQSGWLTIYNAAYYRSDGQVSIVAGSNTLFSPLLALSTDNWVSWADEAFMIYHNGSYNEGAITDITESSPGHLIATCSVWDNAGAIVREVDSVWVTAAWMPSTLYALDFPTPQIGYAVGQSGAVLKSTDGGESWNQLPFVLRLDWFGVKFINENLGWICGENGVIYRTTDGGDNWELQYALGWSNLRSIDFADSLHGIAVGDGGLVVQTDNGGIENQQPSEFARLAPADGSTDPYSEVPYVLFQWQASHDPEGLPVAYNFHLYTDQMSVVDTFLTDTALVYAIPIIVERLDDLVPFHWSVVANDGERERTCSNGTGTFMITWDAAGDPPSASVPRVLELGSFPNPFNPQTNLSLSLPRAGSAQVQVFDILGREVFAQKLGTLPAGTHNITFDGHALPSGLYVAQLTTPYGRSVHKLMLMK
jgi:photosystem II stability/assembly factor-like uncharacterized protein